MQPKIFNAMSLLLEGADRGIVCTVYVVVRACIYLSCRYIRNLGAHNLCPKISQRRAHLYGIYVH